MEELDKVRKFSIVFCSQKTITNCSHLFFKKGKSTACKILSEMGCIAHLDADSIAHSVYSPGSQAVKDAVSEFGSGILAQGSDDTIDRKKLGAIVFSERSEMARLEKIVWPHVKTLLIEKIESLRQDWESEKRGDAIAIIQDYDPFLSHVEGDFLAYCGDSYGEEEEDGRDGEHVSSRWFGRGGR